LEYVLSEEALKTRAEIAEFVKQAASDAGFDLAGIAPAGEFAELAYFPRWIAEGRGGEMRYLEARDEQGGLKRAALARVAPWARSVIVCAMNYNTAGAPSAEPSEAARSGWISRYAWSERDYHDVVIEALRRVEDRIREFAGEAVESRCYVDTGPLVERVYARYAGAGWIGKNTCVINQQLGSWLFLGVILTAMELPPDLPAPDRCGTCRRCLDACPTNAFVAPYQLDASRCISYLTIEKRGKIPTDLRSGIGNNVFGCDICQDVCPWNRRAPVSTLPEFSPRPGLVNPDLIWLATIGEAEFSEKFRASPVKRAKRSGMRRNAVVAMGNSENREFASCLTELAHDPDEVVAAHARWALERLTKSP
jgi:epoxyqueuosine reductase